MMMASVVRALLQGIEPGGTRLESPVSRWQMSDQEIEALVACLQQL